MIPCSAKKLQSQNWQDLWQDQVHDLKEISQEIPHALEFLSRHAKEFPNFPLRLPRSYLKHIKKLNDPLPILKQFVPINKEYEHAPGYSLDPLAEKNSNMLPGLIHKYSSRALLSVTKACAVHCRYCFRRTFSYENNNPGKNGWRLVFEKIKQDKNIKEVILSGGDPLALSNNYLQFFLENLKAICHVKLLRIHTRFPIIIPERIDDEFLKLIKNSGKKIVIVLHCNHPDEITDNLIKYNLKLLAQNVLLLNQSVLLHGVNDDLLTLIALSEKLIANHIKPYYLHILDKVVGTHHFDIDIEKAKILHQSMQANLPGYLVPKLAKEIPGKPNKIIIG